MRPSIEDIRSVLPAASVIRWNLVGMLFPVGISSISGLAGIAASALSAKLLNNRCVSIELPKMTETPVEVNILGFKVRQPGVYDYSKQLTLTFTETVDNVISLFLTTWRELCWNTFTGAQLPKKDLEATVLIQRLNTKDEPIWFYALRGCYLSDFDLGTLDGTTPDAMTPSIILNYDYFVDGPVPSSIFDTISSVF